MPTQRYGITFPFVDSQEGFFLGLNSTIPNEARSNLVHLILTVKGSRYFLPDFGTNLVKYIFEQMDQTTKIAIDREIRESVKEFMPNLKINKVEVKTYEDVQEEEKHNLQSEDPSLDDNTFSFVSDKQKDYTIRVRIDYSEGDNLFETRDFVIITL